MKERSNSPLRAGILLALSVTAVVLAAACSADDTVTPSGSASSADSTSTTSSSTATSSASSGTGGASATSATSSSASAGGSSEGGGGAGGDATTGAGGAGGSELDGGVSDGCVPITNDASKIGATCVDASNCPAGYTCYGMSGIIFQQLCEILCNFDCECPSGLLCKQFSDKGSTWTQCAP